MCLGWRRECRAVSRYPDRAFNASESLEPNEELDVRFPVPEEDPWEAFVPDDDHEPLPEPGEFWCEDNL